MNVDRLAILRPHRTLMHGAGGTDGHAMAAVDAEIPRIRDGNGELVFGDQSTGASPDATAAVDAQTLVGLDDRFHCVGAPHNLSCY